MATRTEADTVYAAGLVQGIVLVTFPAASTIFTDPAQYDLSSTQYGTMFLPQVVTRDHRVAARRNPGSPSRHQARLPGRPAGQHGLDGAAHRQPVRRRRPDRLRAAPRGHGVPGGGLRPGRARAEHSDRGVPPGGGRHVGAHPQRTAGARNRARARLRRDLCGSRVLVGPAGAVGRPADRPARGELAAAVAVGRARGRRAGRGGGSRHPRSLLALRRVRRPLRHLRDHERQLGAA